MYVHTYILKICLAINLKWIYDNQFQTMGIQLTPFR